MVYSTKLIKSVQFKLTLRLVYGRFKIAIWNKLREERRKAGSLQVIMILRRSLKKSQGKTPEDRIRT
jgi:hypothetical protein